MRTALFVLFLVFIGYFLAINLSYLILAFMSQRSNVHRLKQAKYTDFKNILKSGLTIPISIVVPAYNEEVMIKDCIYSCLKIDYPEHEVIVVNDGSTDRTLDILKEEFDLQPADHFYKAEIPTSPIKAFYRSRKYNNLIVADKEHGSRADSINMGVNIAHNRYVCATDADSLFAKDGIIRLMRLVLVDPGRIVAVGGQVRVSNGLKVKNGEITRYGLPHRLSPNFQIVEYLRAFIANRLGWSALNSLLVISGAFGLWRKDAVVEAGGFSLKAPCDDIDMTFKMHHMFRKAGANYQILSMPDPVVWSEVPDRWRDLFRQRARWQRAVISSWFRNITMNLNPRYGTVGLLGMPHYFLFEILGPFVEIAAIVFVILAASFGFLGGLELGLYLIVSVGFTALISMIALFIEQYNYDTYSTSRLPVVVLFAIFEPVYRQFIMLTRIWGSLTFFLRRRGWRPARRTGFGLPVRRPAEPEVKRAA